MIAVFNYKNKRVKGMIHLFFQNAKDKQASMMAPTLFTKPEAHHPDKKETSKLDQETWLVPDPIG